jgi:hypothetical protein
VAIEQSDLPKVTGELVRNDMEYKRTIMHCNNADDFRPQDHLASADHHYKIIIHFQMELISLFPLGLIFLKEKFRKCITLKN